LTNSLTAASVLGLEGALVLEKGLALVLALVSVWGKDLETGLASGRVKGLALAMN
jgi:hypothetical protein